MATSTGANALPDFGRSVLIRWLIATVAFPVGGYLGHAVGGPAATVPAALISGLIAGGIVGLGQGLAIGLRGQAVIVWAAVSAAGLGVALAVVTATVGQIDTTLDAVLLGAVSGLAIGGVQAALLMRDRFANTWIWVVASAVAWAIGWLITAGAVGVGLAPGWPVYGLSGAVVSQVITGVVLWKLISRSEADAPATA
jgi:hypothetical protein